MTSALIIGDVHISEKNPSGRTVEYKNQILAKLKFCVDKANELNVPVVQAGDLFHVKTPSKNSHKLVQEVHDVLKHAINGVWIVPGNHDMSGDRLDSLPKQPLGSLVRMSGINLLIGENEKLPGIAGVPFIREFDGGNWQHALSQYGPDYGNFEIMAEEPTLLVTHAPIFPPGQAPGVYASIKPDAWADYWIGIVATYYGHIHDYHGTYMCESETMQFCNQGALSRGSLHESSINRKPAVTLWDGCEFTRIEVPHLPPEEVFLFDKAAIAEQRKASAQEFADAFASAQVSGLTVEDFLDSLRATVSDAAVYQIIEEAVEESQ